MGGGSIGSLMDSSQSVEVLSVILPMSTREELRRHSVSLRGCSRPDRWLSLMLPTTRAFRRKGRTRRNTECFTVTASWTGVHTQTAAILERVRHGFRVQRSCRIRPRLSICQSVAIFFFTFSRGVNLVPPQKTSAARLSFRENFCCLSVPEDDRLVWPR